MFFNKDIFVPQHALFQVLQIVSTQKLLHNTSYLLCAKLQSKYLCLIKDVDSFENRSRILLLKTNGLAVRSKTAASVNVSRDTWWISRQRALCAHFRTVTFEYPRTLADFKRIPPFRAPLVEVKEPVIMIDCASAHNVVTWLVEWNPLTCALGLFVGNFVRRLCENVFFFPASLLLHFVCQTDKLTNNLINAIYISNICLKIQTVWFLVSVDIIQTFDSV